MTERQQKRNTAGQGQRRKTARPEQLTRKAPETARLQARRNPRRTPRIRKMRRKRIKSTVILVLFLLVVLLVHLVAFMSSEEAVFHSGAGI